MPRPDLDGLDVADLAAILLPGSGRPYPMNEGLESRVFGIDLGSERYVLRIGSDRRSYDKDAYVARSFADSGLPIPPVVTIGEVGAHAYCLTRRLPGSPANRVAPEALAAVTPALVATLHDVWAQDVRHSGGFGMFHHTGNGEFTSWRAYLLDESPVRVAGARARVPRTLVDGLYGYVRERADDCPEVRCLLHGDFGSGNVLVEGTSGEHLEEIAVTSVLDWGLAGYGDHLHDVAEILQWESGEPCMTALAGHLRRSLPRDTETWRRIDCYRARICLGELAWGPESTLDWMIGIGEAILRWSRRAGADGC